MQKLLLFLSAYSQISSTWLKEADDPWGQGDQKTQKDMK